MTEQLGLDAAWAEVEAVLPSDYFMLSLAYNRDYGAWWAAAQRVGEWRGDGLDVIAGDHAGTPAAALRALRAALEGAEK